MLEIGNFSEFLQKFPEGTRDPTDTKLVGHMYLVVWALPRSLATTRGITIVFSSSGYLDVSVPPVRF